MKYKMKKFFDRLAYGIIFAIFGSVIGLIGYAMYLLPEIILPVAIGTGCVISCTWAMIRIGEM